MLRKKLKKQNGFSLIELMMSVVILGVLAALVIGNLNEAVARARYSSMKSNMHNLQVLAETYSGYYGGIYPGTLSQLTTHAKNPSNNYWKDFKNPFSGVNDTIVDMSNVTSTAALTAGGVIYGGSDSPTNMFVSNFYSPPLTSSYVIYGADRNLAPLTFRETFYYLSNN